MESIKTKGKRNCTSACALVDEVISHGVYGLTILKILYMYARTGQLRKRLTDGGSQVSQCWSGRLWIPKRKRQDQSIMQSVRVEDISIGAHLV